MGRMRKTLYEYCAQYPDRRQKSPWQDEAGPSALLPATNLLGVYLQNGKNKEKFSTWMKDTCGANKSQAERCYNAMSEWSDANL
ncbi:UNVERIFIED_CONTAM: hypothetical protein FKN15_025668 [Acipenser sinensis]